MYWHFEHVQRKKFKILYKIMASISMCFPLFHARLISKVEFNISNRFNCHLSNAHLFIVSLAFHPEIPRCCHGFMMIWRWWCQQLLSTVSPRNITDMLTQALTGRFQASTANQESINIWLLGQIAAVFLGNTSTVKDTSSLCGLRRDSRHEPLANFGMHFLSLLGGGDFAGSNSPKLFISVFFCRFTQTLLITV